MVLVNIGSVINWHSPLIMLQLQQQYNNMQAENSAHTKSEE